ncbi:hypothetical protein [Dyadobacter sediminis]|uniref:Uncharacterized protein n=1 Tax=Dyadobacter sediminis TaxID=1493691 RepID=A0A5R9KJF6_9BACT|nr:hypothetical protein [Dyadobacter sediminis]TLU96322.1 hypothetical protein FEM55_04050 [Dyadobacter sediminis]GGB81259.1 hypothetical protein GCM10011325_05910 [Dyadobacter sediminis]
MEQTLLTKGTYIQISVAEKQKLLARELVEYSLKHHPVSNIWDRHAEKLSQTRMLRFTGTLGEILFADCYHLPRPFRSFGASDGQDWGQDFLIKTEEHTFSVDIKSMKRKSGVLGPDYVLNIPASQLNKHGSRTSHYFCISFHQCETNGTIASLLGFVDKLALENGHIGQFYKYGTKRVRTDGSSFTFNESTYEVLFHEMDPPVITSFIRRLKGFRICMLK